MVHHGHDHGYKLLFSHPEMMADLIRGYVRAPWVEQLDFTSLEKVNGSYISDDLRSREDDVVWRLRWEGEARWLYVYLLLEFQSSPERFMALRVLTYLGLLYEDLRRSGQLSADGLLPPVLPVVLYRGSAPWQEPRNITELIDGIPGGLEIYRPYLQYLLLDERRFAEAGQLAARNLTSALFELECSREPADVERVLARLVDWLQRPEQMPLRRSFTIWIKRVLLPGRIRGVDFESLSDLQEVRGMLSERVEEWTQNWKEQGLQEGRRIGIEEGIEQGIQQGERALLMRLVEHKFGPEALEVHRYRIEAADGETLLKWSDRLLTAENADQVFSG